MLTTHKYKIPAIITVILSLTPFLASGQTTTIPGLIDKTGNTLRLIIGVLLLMATVIFLWGVVTFIASAGDPQKRSKAKTVLLWGIIGMTIMVSAWGIATLLVNYFQVPLTPPKQKPPPVLKPI